MEKAHAPEGSHTAASFKKAIGTVSSTISLSQPSSVHTQAFFIPQFSLTAWKALHRLTCWSIITIIPTEQDGNFRRENKQTKKADAKDNNHWVFSQINKLHTKFLQEQYFQHASCLLLSSADASQIKGAKPKDCSQRLTFKKSNKAKSDESQAFK